MGEPDKQSRLAIDVHLISTEEETWVVQHQDIFWKGGDSNMPSLSTAKDKTGNTTSIYKIVRGEYYHGKALRTINSRLE